MSVSCQRIIDALERLAPRRWAEEWDNVGLMTGSPAQTIRKVAVALDVTADLLERLPADTDMIVSHHPLIFQPVKNLREDLPAGRLLAALVRRKLAVYCAHTNLDAASGGINDLLAERFALAEVKVLQPGRQDGLYKLVVFVPTEASDKVHQAMAAAGAGHIGNYSHCSFQTTGTGTFLPLAGTQPYIGTIGALERVAEVRLETVVPATLLDRVVRAMLRAHPYEEVAYDVVALQNTPPLTGLGRIGHLPAPLSLTAFAAQVQDALGGNAVRLVGAGDKLIRKVAVCGGSGASLIGKAAFAGADVLVTGDVKYHDAQLALEQGISLVDAGHFATEAVAVPAMAGQITAAAAAEGWDLEIWQDAAAQDLFRTL